MKIPQVKASYQYVTELHERLEDSLKLEKRYKKHYDKKAKPRRLEVGDQVLILLPTESNKLLMQWRGPYFVESRVGAKDYRVKMGSKTKTYHVDMLKKYVAGEPEVDVLHTSNKDDATIAVVGVIYQDTDPENQEPRNGTKTKNQEWYWNQERYQSQKPRTKNGTITRNQEVWYSPTRCPREYVGDQLYF